MRGLVPVEALGGQGETPRGALADGLDHERADGRRGQADAHFRQAELRVVSTNGHVAAADQTDAAAKHRALHHGQGRLFQLVEVVQQLGEGAGVLQVAVEVQIGRLLHPAQVAAGTEVFAATAQHQQAHVWVTAHRI